VQNDLSKERIIFNKLRQRKGGGELLNWKYIRRGERCRAPKTIG